MRFGVWTAFAMAIGVGCGGHEEEEPGPICAELTEACHEAGEIDDEAAACHDIAHEAVEEDCDADLDRCTTLCADVMAAAE